MKKILSKKSLNPRNDSNWYDKLTKSKSSILKFDFVVIKNPHEIPHFEFENLSIVFISKEY